MDGSGRYKLKRVCETLCEWISRRLCRHDTPRASLALVAVHEDVLETLLAVPPSSNPEECL